MILLFQYLFQILSLSTLSRKLIFVYLVIIIQKMSGTLNKVMLIGHLGDDVKIKHFDNGGCIARFPLATNESYTNKTTNEKVTNTDWHNIVVRNKAAEVCEKYLSKGDKVYVEGKLRTRKWQGDDGADRYTTEVNVDEFTFLSTKKDSGNNLEQSSPPVENNKETDQVEDDLPF